jgi:hypothetical protein
MKRCLKKIIIVLALMFFSGAAYGGDKPIEKVLDQKIPEAWGTLKTVVQFPNLDLVYLYFEDSKGTIRKATLEQGNNTLYGATVVIERSK